MTNEDNTKKKTWLTRYWTNEAHEPEKSFTTFTLMLQHPTWDHKRLSKETKIPIGTIEQWSSKYKYKERRQAKIEYEAQQIDKIQFESKTRCIKKNALRNILDEDLLDAYAEFNSKLIRWLEVDEVTEDVMKKQRLVNKHLNDYLDLRGKHLRNLLDTDELIKKLESTDDVENAELNTLARALMRSHDRLHDTMKELREP